MVLSRFATFLALSLLLPLNAFAHRESVWLPIGRLDHPPIRESSGIARSHRYDGVYWTLNDSGNSPHLFAVRRDGSLIREFPVEGATNVDWEGMFLDDRGIWVGEIGNNSWKREDLKLYLVPEPDPYRDTTTVVEAVYPYHYPDQNPDAEGLIVHNGLPFIISKEQERAVLYRFPHLRSGEEHVLERVGDLSGGARWITGASLTPDGTRLAVTTYDRVWIYHADAPVPLSDLIATPPWTLAHTFGTEAVGFTGQDLLFTSEGRPLHLLPAWWYEREKPLPPRSAVRPPGITRRVGASPPRPVVRQRYRDLGVDIPGEHIVYEAGPAGELRFDVNVGLRDRYRLTLVTTRGPGYGPVRVSVDRAETVTVDLSADQLDPCSVIDAGKWTLTPGNHTVTLETQGGAIGLDSYLLTSAAPFADEFLVLGPFDKSDPDRIDDVYPPEVNLDLDHSITLTNGRVLEWTPLETEPDNRLEFWRLFGVEDAARPVVAYAYTEVWSDRDRKAVMLVGSDDQVAVWLNGEEVHRNNVSRGAVWDDDAVPCSLKSGWNTVLCKVGQIRAGWRLYLRFTDPDGTARYRARL